VEIGFTKVKNDAARQDYEEKISRQQKNRQNSGRHSGSNTAITGDRQNQLKPTILEFDDTSIPFKK
jgi:hypothetical protein